MCTNMEKIEVLNTNFTRDGNDEFVLHHMLGSDADKSDFAPLRDTLPVSTSRKLSAVGGRSSNRKPAHVDRGFLSNGVDVTKQDGSFPFFDLIYDNVGIIFAIGWSGQWAAKFSRDKDKSLNVIAGMELTHLKLLPGEEIRTPRILMFFWDGKRIDAHNDFRRFILKYHTPLKNGKPVTCPIAANSWLKHNCGSGVTEKNQIEFVNQFIKNRIEIEYFWLDAGWYEGVGPWHHNVGNWFPKKKAFPCGLKPVADHAKKNGMGFVLWFEPERVYPGTWLFKEHPEWLFMPTDETKKKLRQRDKVEALLNLGNLEACQWLTNHISSMIKENGVNIYRQDFNFDPLDYWRANDAPDRQGISEIRYIEGLYAFWDELLHRHPELIIDNCASGGRRLDLETISRSVALWRSDYFFEPEGAQSHTLGINKYLPCGACGCDSTDPYIFRSHLSSGITLCWDPEKKDFNVEEAHKRIKEFKLLRPLFYGDFYSLTAHSISSEVWCAYQLERKDLNFGAVLAFRRKESPYSAASFKLQGLDVDGCYEFTDIDSGIKKELTGRELMKNGIEIKMSTAPCSLIFTYSWTLKGAKN